MECFIYARKSTESEDRQILSIEAQIKELKAVALKQGLKIVEVFSEAKSAKAPGRPIFNKMMQSVFKSGGANILCWKLDRLARNPIDGGSLIWAVEQNKLTGVFTPGRYFKNSGDDKFFMQLEFGIAKKYIDDLSENVKRGNRAKLEKGILPGKAPIGYSNDKENKVIVKDPERFGLVRKIWDTVLSQEKTIRDLLKTVNEDWGLTTPQYKHRGGKPLTIGYLYCLLKNPFYCGLIRRKEGVFQGNHEPMITKSEFDKVQAILGRSARSPERKNFPYTGLIKCGECGSMITAENKTNRYGYKYTYYRCTKKRGGLNNACRQKYIRVEKLENQALVFLEKLYLSKEFTVWAEKQSRKIQKDEEKLQLDVQNSLDKSLSNCNIKLDNLLDLKLKNLLTDEEFVSEKARLFGEKFNLEQKISDLKENPQLWLEPSMRLFSFAILAKKKFENGDDAEKRKILSALGSNLILKDKNLLIEAKEPFRLTIEAGKNPIGWGLLERVRTFFADPSNHFHIPVLEKVN